MFLTTYTTTSQFNRQRLHIVLRCDTCQREFETHRRYVLKRKYHWCCVVCTNAAMKAGGVIHNKTKSTWRQSGYEHPMLSPSIQAKHQKSCLEHHGVATPFQMQHVRKRLTDEDVIERKFATYNANKTFKNSKPEQRFYELLLQQFQSDDIVRQHRIKGTLWPIDFYVKSINTWIQIDGIYWHGLDGQLDYHRMKMHISKRSAMIVHKWETDRAQDTWFAEHSMCLIRITDKQVNQMNDVLSLRAALQAPHAASR